MKPGKPLNHSRSYPRLPNGKDFLQGIAFWAIEAVSWLQPPKCYAVVRLIDRYDDGRFAEEIRVPITREHCDLTLQGTHPMYRTLHTALRWPR